MRCIDDYLRHLGQLKRRQIVDAADAAAALKEVQAVAAEAAAEGALDAKAAATVGQALAVAKKRSAPKQKTPPAP